MFKKYVCVALAILSFVSLISCSKDTDKLKSDEEEKITAPVGYIGEGLRTMYDVLLTADVTLVNDVLKYGSPDYDTSKKKTDDKETYYLIVDEDYNTYEKLRYQLDCVFSKDSIDQILNEYNQYKEFDGKLYVSKTYVESLDQRAQMSTDTHNFIVNEKTDTLCVALCKVKCGDNKKREIEVRFVKQESEWKIENILVG